MTLAILITVIVIALAFDYTNGFHDAANAIATAVSTRALTPRIALLMAAVMNFVGALLGQAVAKTVQGILGLTANDVHHSLVIVLAALIGAIVWNVITWYFGLPSSSSHALIGALVGAGIAAGGSHAVVHWSKITDKVLLPMVLSPVVGFLLAYALMMAFLWIFRRSNPHKTFRGFRMGQSLSAAALALGHGLQDAQKTMGVIFLALGVAYPLTYGKQHNLPLWVVLLAASAISLGTYSGGWRVMKTLGRKIIKVDPARGFAAESVGATVLYATAYIFQAPISTTHVITSAVMGAGATQRFNSVRWNVALNIVGGWILTFPAAGLVAAGMYELLKLVLL
ncbi:inorganic phosphate transporter [Nocardioides baekrokdamisoli]|uniref:Inorganic phosphate transporter n=1 Tax=Nocardioides baekrokdamisoli TaxID=1804624 RepID=A0A3G9J2C6_9ACTN|nr:inorganic phosphate transporter [Nocardioides baekrokdamisoli]BBH17149.1 inorganic phosphate transporter [Nocardioides baekrokdamisoli]